MKKMIPALFILGIFPVWGCFVQKAIPMAKAWSTKHTKTVPQKLYPSKSSIDILADVGDVTVIGEDRDTIAISGKKTLETRHQLSSAQLDSLFSKIRYTVRTENNKVYIRVHDGKDVINYNNYLDIVLRIPKSSNLSVVSDIGDISLKNMDSHSLYLEADTGDIEVDSLPSKLEKLEVLTDTGDVELSFPSTLGFSLNVKTDMGDIETWQGDYEESFRTVRGNGKAKVRIVTDLGDIELQLK